MSTVEVVGTRVEREIAGVGTLTFVDEPVGALKPDGTPRSKPYRAYKLNGRRLPSVTTILGATLPAPGLIRWAEEQGARGAWQLAQEGMLPSDVTEVIRAVRQFQLGADSAREQGADRGLDIHSVWECYMRTGSPPKPSEHPEEHRPFLRALTRWLLDRSPEPIEDSIERVVCHPELGYAGRMDLRAIIDGRDLVIDGKTQANGGIYDKAVIQARMYAEADVACGEPEPDGTLIVVFDSHGDYHELDGIATRGTVEAVMAHYHHLKPITKLLDDRYWARRRARAAA